MTLNISTNARNLAGDIIYNLIDIGSILSSGQLEFRTGTKPANPQTTPTGDILTTLTFSLPAFKTFVNGQSYANPITKDIVILTGNATWFRIYDKDKTAIMDGDVSNASGNGDIKFNNTLFVKGGSIAVTSLLAIIPESSCT